MSDAPHASRLRLGLTVVVAALVLGADQITKALILDALGPQSMRTAIDVVPGLLNLILVQNTGAAFGIFQDRSPVLMILALAVVVFLLYYFRRAIEANSWLALALGLQIGGALGNVVDRLRHGYVVDFIHVPHWPTFNVADSCVTVGVAILALYLITREPAPETSDAPPAAPGPGAAEVQKRP